MVLTGLSNKFKNEAYWNYVVAVGVGFFMVMSAMAARDNLVCMYVYVCICIYFVLTSPNKTTHSYLLHKRAVKCFGA